MKLEYVKPSDIERRSFEIIESELGGVIIPDEVKPIVLRAIHTTADFDYAKNLYFSENAVKTALAVLAKGCTIVTDTNMAKAGINKAALERHGCECLCFMSDGDVAEAAKKNGTTRAAASVDKAAELRRPIIYAVGNAPTALVRLCEHIEKGDFVPELVVGAPVGFVNVIQSKEMIVNSGVPCIAAMGRKGGSTIAAALINALLYEASGNVR
jgi:precorrin-8X/cobalt-precorrin-8 methylmutase